MADDLQNYKLQLQQVEAALLTDSDNKELHKLKIDLEEVIDLTLDLKHKAEEASRQPEYHVVPSEDDEITKSLLAVEEFVCKTKKQKLWRVGDACMAKWSDNNQYYAAKIDAINADGQVNVTYQAYQSRGVTTLGELKVYPGEKRLLTEAERLKRAKSNNKECLKKKKIKKALRFKEMEEEREAEKNKWLAFNNKAGRAKKGGVNNKSIFASPESVNGRVGIGTCGISGKPMTGFSCAEKYKRGAQ